MTHHQRNAIPAALTTAEEFAEANGLTTNLVTYCEVKELGNGSGDYGVTLFTTDRDGYEVDVRVKITQSGTLSPAQGFDSADRWALA